MKHYGNTQATSVPELGATSKGRRRSGWGPTVSGMGAIVSFLLGLVAVVVFGSPAGAQTTPPSLAINDVSLAEGNSGTKNAVFTITRSGALTGTSSVNWATVNGSAIAPGDFTAASGTAHFVANQTTQTVAIAVVGDTVVEPDETFTVKLSAPVDATLSDDTGLGTIKNDDTALAISNASIWEGNTGTKQATFTVTRTGLLTGKSSVNWATQNVSATAPSDFVAASGTVSFDADQSTRTLSVTINGDIVVEPNETFRVNLSAAAGATIIRGSGVGTIRNDDQAMSVNDVSLTEGNSGTKLATFTVSRSGLITGAASVTWRTEDITATAGQDYVAQAPTSIPFAANQATLQVSVAVNGDTTVESTEAFAVKLSAPTGGAIITDDTGIGTIANDDAALSFAGASRAEGNSGTGEMVFTVTRHGTTGHRAQVDFGTFARTAEPGLDYETVQGTLYLDQDGSTAQVRVPVRGDLVVEGNEIFDVGFYSPVGATISNSYVIGTIVNDDAPASLRAHNYPEKYIREKNTLGELTNLYTELDIRQGTFKIVPGLADPAGISFESTANPGTYLRHEYYRMKVHPIAADDQWARDEATYYAEPGLSDPSKFSFRSKNEPNHYIRHQNFHLYLQSGSDQLFRDDSTFAVVPPPPVASVVPVPDVMGMTEAAAKAALEESSFGWTVPLPRPIDCETPGTVLGQDPAGGTLTAPGSIVTLTIGRYHFSCDNDF